MPPPPSIAWAWVPPYKPYVIYRGEGPTQPQNLFIGAGTPRKAKTRVNFGKKPYDDLPGGGRGEIMKEYQILKCNTLKTYLTIYQV